MAVRWTSHIVPSNTSPDKLLHLGPVSKDDLRALGLQVVELDLQGTSRAFEHVAQYRALKVNDYFALALAEQTPDCILLTGDSFLCRIDTEMGIEVHGVLWTIDELERTSLATAQQLYDALSLFEQDSLVFLPKDEIRQRLRRLRRSI